MPAEFKEHLGCWMIWPTRKDLFYDNVRPTQETFKKIAHSISKYEKLFVGVKKGNREQVRSELNSGIEIVEIESNDFWVRDTGPTFVINEKGGLSGVNWNFDSYNHLNLYYDLDKTVASQILNYHKVDKIDLDLILEGGTIHVDGDGTLITIEAVINDRPDNMGLSKKYIEDIFNEYLGIKKVIWIKEGLKHDCTGGHIDNLLCFIEPGKLFLSWTDDKEDEQYEVYKSAYEQLSGETDAKGRNFEIIKLHQPNPLYYTEEECDVDPFDNEGNKFAKPGDRMAASYANFYISNGAIILPGFGDKEYDNKAKEKVSSAFPGKEVIQINSRNILLGGGNIHCITQQIPKV